MHVDEQTSADSAGTSTTTEIQSVSAPQNTEVNVSKEFDMKSAVDTVSASLFPKLENKTDEADNYEKTEALVKEPVKTDQAGIKTETKTEIKAPITAKTAPQSWKKEMHDNWSKLEPPVQDYIELREKQMAEGLEKDRSDANLGRVMRDTMSPYKAMLQAQGVDEPRAVQALLNAHYKLTNGDSATKAGFFKQLAKDYGVDIGQIASMAEGTTQTDPQYQALQNELNGIKYTISSSQQRTLQETKERVLKDVEAFASDPGHSYFDEVSGEMTALIQAGYDLKDAYEKAVWANPITRQKEISRLQTEQEIKIKEQTKSEAESAKKAASINVRGRDTKRTPTEPKGTMEDTMRLTLQERKSRS
jgi:hypothetical protein